MQPALPNRARAGPRMHRESKKGHAMCDFLSPTVTLGTGYEVRLPTHFTTGILPQAPAALWARPTDGAPQQLRVTCHALARLRPPESSPTPCAQPLLNRSASSFLPFFPPQKPKLCPFPSPLSEHHQDRTALPHQLCGQSDLIQTSSTGFENKSTALRTPAYFAGLIWHPATDKVRSSALLLAPLQLATHKKSGLAARFCRAFLLPARCAPPQTLPLSPPKPTVGPKPKTTKYQHTTIHVRLRPLTIP